MKTAITILPIVALATCLLSTPAQADYDCEKINLEDSFECADTAVATEKKRLNKAYMSIYRGLNASQKTQMDNQQIAWLKQRDSNCITVDESQTMNNMVVYQMISDNLCIARATKKRADYYLNQFKPSHLTSTAGQSATGFRKTKTVSGGDISHYQGIATVNGVLNVSHPDDDYTPCGLCFSVSDADSHKIPRDADDERSAWFGFSNVKYNRSNRTYQLGTLTLDSTKCYAPMNATIEIKDYIADKTPTETIDQTSLVRFISMDKPQVIQCEDFAM